MLWMSAVMFVAVGAGRLFGKMRMFGMLGRFGLAMSLTDTIWVRDLGTVIGPLGDLYSRVR